MHWKCAEDLGNFKKSQLVGLRPVSGEDGWLLLVHRGLGQVSHEMGGRLKSQNRKNVYLSPYVEEPLNSKVIKSFVPELRSRYVLFEFQDSYVLCIYIWTLYVHFIYPYRAMVYFGKGMNPFRDLFKSSTAVFLQGCIK